MKQKFDEQPITVRRRKIMVHVVFLTDRVASRFGPASGGGRPSYCVHVTQSAGQARTCLKAAGLASRQPDLR